MLAGAATTHGGAEVEWFTFLPDHNLYSKHIGTPSNKQWPAGDPCPGDLDTLVYIYRNVEPQDVGSSRPTERS